MKPGLAERLQDLQSRVQSGRVSSPAFQADLSQESRWVATTESLGSAVESFMTGMRDAEKDRLASSVADRHSEFEAALVGNRRKYPTREFRLFAEAVRRYVEKIRGDEMMHRDVVGAVHGLVDFLRVERKRVPGEVLFEAERLECLLFLGYDPHFDGDEPPEV